MTVQVGPADQRVVPPAAWGAGSGGCRGSVDVALSSPDVAPPAAIRDVAELGDVDVDQRTRVGVLVAAQWFTGDPVDSTQTVDPAADQHGVHGRGR